MNFISDLAAKLKGYGSSASAVTRYVGTFAGGAAMAIGILGFNAITSDQVTQLFGLLKDLGTGLSTTFTALGGIVSLAATVYGAWKASRAQQTKTVASTPGVQVHVDTSAESGAPEAVKALAKSDDPAVHDVVPMTGGPVDAMKAKP